MILLELFLTFLKIGAFTFGGGYAMLPLIQEEVAAHGWLGSAALVNFVAVSESTPGPFAINIATYVGAETAGLFGAFCATFGVVLPSFVIILIVAKCYDKFRSSRIVGGCMSGLKPAVVGLIGASVVSVGETVLFPAGLSAAAFGTAALWVSLAIFAVSAVFTFRKAHPILVICLSAALGIAAGYAGLLA
ncbi:MAG: chromate transporter [Acutalibacteraceae bacterium]